MRRVIGLMLFAALIGSSSAAEKPRETDAAPLVRWLVANQDGLRDVSFAKVVEAATGHRVLPVDAARDAGWLNSLGAVLDAALSALNSEHHPIHNVERMNEASRFAEDEIRRQINLLPGWKCTVPATEQNREQRAGYPDLRVVIPGGAVCYLDPKLHDANSRDSSLRTFYYEPRALTGKIREDAVHLLVGVEHSGKSAAAMRLTKWELIDVSKLRVRLKPEFQASNADIYRAEAIVGRSAE